MANNLTRFDPFGDLVRFDLFHTFDDFFTDFRLLPRAGLAPRMADSAPRIRLDIAETDQAYTIKAEIPGVKKDDIKIAIDGRQVSISAETQKEEEQKTATLVCNERYYGQQSRSFTLPHEVDEQQADARYEDGMLELTLPKKAGATRKQITVQ